jgi:predicted nucleic acid-binding Zn ribbon protein
MRRLLGTGAGIIFKGTGFYATDYRRTEGGKGKSESTTESKSEGKSEKKSASKSDEAPKSTNGGSGNGKGA